MAVDRLTVYSTLHSLSVSVKCKCSVFFMAAFLYDNSKPFTHSCLSLSHITYTLPEKPSGGHLELSILPKDTLAFGIGETGIKPQNLLVRFPPEPQSPQREATYANCPRMVKYSKTLEWPSAELKPPLRPNIPLKFNCTKFHTLIDW